MQTWIRANIGKLIDRLTKAETAISGSQPYENENDLDGRVSELETAVGTPYENETNLDNRVTATENAIGIPYTNTDDIDTRLTALENAPAPVGADTIYSTTTEQEVGQWIDGKTIYKKTYYAHELTNTAYIDVTDPGDGSSFDTFVKYEVITTFVDSSYNLAWAGPSGNNNAVALGQKNNRSNNITIYFNNPHPITEAWVTIWYTKTPAPVETKKKKTKE